MTFIQAKKPNGQVMYINLELIKAFKENPMNDKQCIIYINAEDINLNAFGPQAEENDLNDYTVNVFYVDKETLYDLIEYFPVPNTNEDDEEIGEPITDSSEFEDPNEDADDEEIGVGLSDLDEGFEEPNED